jgi:hypothetical protein
MSLPQEQHTAARPGLPRMFIALALAGLAGAILLARNTRHVDQPSVAKAPSVQQAIDYQPRKDMDTSGYGVILNGFAPWKSDSTLQELAELWQKPGLRGFEKLEQQYGTKGLTGTNGVNLLVAKAAMLNWDNEAERALKVLQEAREMVEADPALASECLYSIIFMQGVTGLRCGENENCVLCRGESACILPISPSAVHTKPRGSRLAIQYFSEYLDRFPDDLEVRWLLNLAHMTLGEYPGQVKPGCLVNIDRYLKSEFDIGKFRDVSEQVGLGRMNQAGGAIMDDFDNDGLLDVVVTSMDPTEQMAIFRNKGDGTFEDRTAHSGLVGQLGGLNCVQADYNNDGHLDVFVVRGAWMPFPMRPSLLRNNGDGTFTDVTKEAGMMEPVNSICASWADYDNDGLLDLFICCEKQPNRLYHNKGDGTFEEVAVKAGLQGTGKCYKGCAWIDYDNDGYPDIFLNVLNDTSRLFHNNRDGTFTEVTAAMGIDGPLAGFSCWAWDYDNDGYPDIFATSFNHTLGDIVKGLTTGEPHNCFPNRLYRNMGGKRFKDVTKEAGLDMCFASMGTNFGDFDNDGFLDMYLGTGDPNLHMLVPNRMFKNVGGKRFAEITASSGTGHLQKGHGVACGDWARDGNVDIFIEMGGAVNGDRYHNVLFQNPGHDNRWLTVKLIGKKTNRSAIGARIKAVTAGAEPLTVYRHVSSGSSFGANPLQQTLGLGKADKVATLEIYWPTSGTTQVFHDVDVNQAVEITEFAKDYRKLDWKPLPRPK